MFYSHFIANVLKYFNDTMKKIPIIYRLTSLNSNFSFSIKFPNDRTHEMILMIL